MWCWTGSHGTCEAHTANRVESRSRGRTRKGLAVSRYEFVIAGRAAGLVESAFPDLVLNHVHGADTTALVGDLVDQAAVRAVIARIDDLCLTLLEFRQLDDSESPDPA